MIGFVLSIVQLFWLPSGKLMEEGSELKIHSLQPQSMSVTVKRSMMD